jgi:hypothetical protein
MSEDRISLERPTDTASVAITQVVEAVAHAPGPWPDVGSLLRILEDDERVGFRARWLFPEVIAWMRVNELFSDDTRSYDYITKVLTDAAIQAAVRWVVDREHEYKSTIDELFRSSSAYRESVAFQEMITFCARFRAYAPFNNMLVKVQNRSCSFFATRKHWLDEFGCEVKEDARPMLILAPMHPVMLVYDLDSVEDPPVPEKLKEFGTAPGEWKPERLERLIENAKRWGIRVDYKPLSSTHGGFATRDTRNPKFKMRIAVHNGLDFGGRFAALCHELAHIHLGHLGTDRDLWWPSRSGLSLQTVEIEAEAVAHIVMQRTGLKSASPAYLSSYLSEGSVPETVSVDLISKVAGKLEEMSLRLLSEPKPKGLKKSSAKVTGELFGAEKP